MKKCAVKLVVFNGEDFDYWKNRTRNYLLSQDRAIWEIVQEAYAIPATLDNTTQGELQRYENNYKALNLITIALGRNVYDRVAHLETVHNVWLKLCNTYEGSSEIKSSRTDTYNRQYQTFSQKPDESLDDSVWGMKITALEEFTDFATLDTKKLFNKLKSHKLSRNGHSNHDASLTSKTFVTSTRIGVHMANHTNTTDSSALEFALSSLTAASDEQYESIPDDEIALLIRKSCTLHRLHKERRRSPRGCFECGDTTHFIVDCPKRKKLNSSNKYNYNNWNDSNDKGEGKKYRFGDKKKKFQKMMPHTCAALSDLDFSSDDSSSSEEDEKPKRKIGDFTSLCLMGKSSQHIFDSDISDDSSPESPSLRVIELENALCNQDKLLCKIFH
jgi:hypothetical protein